MNIFTSPRTFQPAAFRLLTTGIAFGTLAASLLCVAAPRPASPEDVPSVNASMGSCTADFTVVDTASKPIYDAKIHAKIKYGFMSKHDTDMEVGTNSDGKARIIGLPEKLKKPPMDFMIVSPAGSKTVSNDPATNCNAVFSITLGN